MPLWSNIQNRYDIEATESRTDALAVVRLAVQETLGFEVDMNAPLMSAGIDSLQATELITLLSDRLGTEVEPTVLFDHPTIDSLANFVANEYSLDEKTTNEAPKSLWDLYSELKQKKTDELFVPPAAKSARRAVVLLAFAGSGCRDILSTLGSHQQLCVCEDLCLMPFKTLAERPSIISSTETFQDGLISTIQALRNCEIPDMTDLFGSVANTYRALQEWCAPRILVDGTEAYSAAPEWSLIQAKHVFLDPDFVHLLRNPRGCLRNAQGSGDTVELEKQWVNFTKSML